MSRSYSSRDEARAWGWIFTLIFFFFFILGPHANGTVDPSQAENPAEWVGHHIGRWWTGLEPWFNALSESFEDAISEILGLDQ